MLNIARGMQRAMKDPRSEEMDDTQSYIEQMVAATTARAVPQPEADFDEEGFDEPLDAEEDVVPAGGDFDEIAVDEFAEFDE